jgi:arsenite-transporting ATPase
VFLAGKGGVGKTTCAAALALALAGRGERVLVASIDPAHSLGDVLGAPLGARARAVPRATGRLFALELDAERAAAAWVARRRPALVEVASSSGALDEETAARFTRLPLPAVDELAALLALARWARQKWDRVIVDAAPSGHFLALLRAPAAIADLARTFEAARRDARRVETQLAGRAVSSAADGLVDELKALAGGLTALLRDPNRVAVRWVLLPEDASLEETRDGLAALAAEGVRVEELIVNRAGVERRAALPARSSGRRGRMRGDDDELRSDVAALLANALLPATVATAARELQRLAPGARWRLLPTLPREPRQRNALRALGGLLAAATTPGGDAAARAARTPPRRTRSAPLPSGRRGSGSPRRRHGTTPPLVSLCGPPVRAVWVLGKGGVGKTTVACSLALLYSRGGRDVRLLSVDPAPSLGDVLRMPLDDRWRALTAAPALRARELEAGAVWRTWRRRFDRALARDPAAARASSGVFGDPGATPEGFAELAAALDLATALDPRSPALWILDTPPTGHALRLLAAPDAALAWIHAALAALLDVRAAVPLGPFARWLLGVSRRLKHLRDLFHDPTRTAIVVVTRPGRVVEAETERLLRRLPAAAVAARALVRLGDRGGAPVRDRGHRDPQKRCAIIEAALWNPPPLGASELLRWASSWNALEPSAS